MTTYRMRTDLEYPATGRSLREALALALDGTLPRNDVESDAGYRAAMEPLAIAMRPQLLRFRQLAAAGQVSASARFHITHRLLGVLGATPAASSAIPEDDSWPGIVFVGCLTPVQQADSRWMERMLARGAIVVTSDKTAAVPVISNGLRVNDSRSGRRARVTVGTELASLLTDDGDWNQFVIGMRPVVRLAPGHLPLRREQPIGTRIIARDALTDEPLVIVADIAGGQVVHSVAHWWQDAEPDTTELGRWLLVSVPAFAVLGMQYREARLGGFGAGSVMLASLLAGLDAALDRAGIWVACHDSANQEGLLGSAA